MTGKPMFSTKAEWDEWSGDNGPKAQTTDQTSAECFASSNVLETLELLLDHYEQKVLIAIHDLGRHQQAGVQSLITSTPRLPRAQ